MIGCLPMYVLRITRNDVFHGKSLAGRVLDLLFSPNAI